MSNNKGIAYFALYEGSFGVQTTGDVANKVKYVIHILLPM